jgi:hypothetical protein
MFQIYSVAATQVVKISVQIIANYALRTMPLADGAIARQLCELKRYTKPA